MKESADSEGQDGSHAGGVERFFDVVAPNYDRAVRDLGWEVNAMVAPLLKLSGRPVASLLDLGAGTGLTMAAICASAKPQTAVAVDVSAGMLEQLKARLPDATVIHADLLTFLDRENSRFDLVTAIGVFEHIADAPRLISRVAQRMATHALFIFTHEPLGPESRHQAVMQTPEVREAEVAVTMYRHNSSSIRTLLAGNGLQIIAERAIAKAYSTPDRDVAYRLIAARKER